MHESVKRWVRETIDREHVEGLRVLEVGSYDVNGSVRPHIESLEPAQYLGVDMRDGPGVDRIVDCEQLCDHVGAGAWDFVVSTEMLEHVRDWRTCIFQLFNAVAPGGQVLITTRGPGFPFHDFPEDHWRYTLPVMHQILDALGFTADEMLDDPLPTHPGVFVLATRGHWELDQSKLDDITVLRVEECDCGAV